MPKLICAELGSAKLFAPLLKIEGNAEYFLSDFEQSISTFITLLDRHPDDEDGSYMLGRIYYQEGRVDEALGQFQRTLKLNPRSYKAWDNLGLCWEARGDNAKATAHFLKAIQLVEIDALVDHGAPGAGDHRVQLLELGGLEVVFP